MNKKLILFFVILVAGLIVSGCQLKKEQAEEKSYHYANELLNFSLDLPSDFEYYQTQRKEQGQITDLEIFVPTADTAYPQDVPGYAKPIIIRVMAKSDYNKLVDSDETKKDFTKIADKSSWLLKKDGKVYLIKFWREEPSDWQGKWTQEMRDKILASFKLI